jgi:pSer/pThr/pTyr-binding forkhead associated (FHA) protein
VSRRHARIVVDSRNAGVVLEDLDSKNGTLLRGVLVDDPVAMSARRQLFLPINDNYFCRRRVSKGAPLATPAELGNCRWPVAGRG